MSMKNTKVQPDRNINFTQTDQQHDLLQDRLSFLPDSLLVSVLSILPIKDAVATSILSHHWRHLWTQIYRLKLLYSADLPRQKDGDSETDGLPSFLATVDRIFQQLTSTKIYSLDISITNDFLHYCNLELFIHRAIALNVEEIRVTYDFDFVYVCQLILPCCIFQCPSLVVLELIGDLRIEMPCDGNINLPNLKELCFKTSRWEFDCESMANLLKSCPALEDLSLIIATQFWEDNTSIFLHVSCQNLRSLHIKAIMSKPAFQIDAPRLKILDILMVGGFVSCRFFPIPRTLVNVAFHLLKDSDGSDHVGQLQQLLRGICYTEYLIFNNFLCSLNFGGFVLPCFPNLAQLYIYSHKSSVCNNLLCFLRCTPNLEALSIEGKFLTEEDEWNVTDEAAPACLPRKLKEIEVRGMEGSSKELKFLKFVLHNANVLEKLCVDVLSTNTVVCDELGFCEDLFRCPRSSTCVIDFRCGYLHASSEEFNDSLGTVDCHIKFDTCKDDHR